MQIDGRDDTHICLAPLAAAVRYLALEELERVQAQGRLWDLKGFAEDGGGFVLDEEEGTVGFPLGDLLEEPEEVDVCEEEARGVVSEWDLRQGAACREAELVDFWPRG